MGRTYSFEPFLSQQPAQTYKGSGPRLGNEEHKIALTKEEEKAALPDTPTGYGQAHAETVKRYRARAEKKRTEPKTPATRAKKAAPKAKPTRKVATQEATAKAPTRQAREETEPKAPARKKLSATGLVGSIGRKVVTRAAVAAKKTVARAVKTAAARKSAKKR
ncbi:hypothetical protein [Cystobacter ferrugineus]|uniref:Uncharacterized protein n=1 Tax=Cystobacter ferrugineus TaxID=83449 RepID=A0A1L9AY75_9BACT|nr:hypothetical protein [Cystobacter ferrugineus]OJH34853.1 hypothetical protein BON30_40370 [Cystobacter ferrugineus]